MSRVNELKHKERFNSRKVKTISLVSFLMGFAGSFIAYVASYYFKEVTGTDNIGIFYSISYIVSLVMFLNLHKLVKKLGRSLILYILYLVSITSTFFLIILEPSYWGIFFIMTYIISRSMSWVTLDLILEVFSKDAMSGRIRGLYLTIINFGFILGPFISTRILDTFGFSGIFFAMMVINMIAFVISLINLRKVNHVYKKNITILKMLKKVMQRKNVLRIYYISFVLEFFYGIMVFFAPLYLLEIGFSWLEMGSIFTIMLLPFIIFQYPVGIIADKKTGEKELIMLSLFIMGISVILVYFSQSQSVVMWGLILFLTRVGASLIEILRDSYFYKRIDSEDVDLIDFFRTSRPVAYIASSLIATLVLIKFPLSSLFIILAIVVFSGLYPAFNLIDNKCEDELKGCK